jgi:PAS domain S-box-containing protein
MSPVGLRMLEADSADQVVGCRIHDFVSPRHREAFLNYAHGVFAGQNGSFEFEALTKKGHSVWLETRAVPLRGDGGEIVGLLAATHDISARKHNEATLRRQLVAMEGAMDGMALVDRDSKYVYLNEAHVKLFGYTHADELIGKTWRELYGEAEIRRFEQDIFPVFMRDGHWQGEAVAQRRDGSQFHQGLSLTAMEDGGVVCVCRDITEQKRAQKQLLGSLREKEALLQEVHHRVKNNLQVVSSLLNLQSAYVRDNATKRMIHDSQARLHAMSLIHETLYRSTDLSRIDFAEYGANLAQHLTHANDLEGRGIELVTALEPVPMPIDTAIACGLILNELVSNCVKHAFPGKRAGTIRVELVKSAHGKLALTVADDGVGLPADFNGQGAPTLGMRIVSALGAQLAGTLEFLSCDPGTAIRLTFGEHDDQQPDPHG